MVKGLVKFRIYFKDFADNYVIIGGTACNELVADKDLNPRATKDIDAILVVEALNESFVNRFWEFVRAGQYELWETSSGKTQFYRFIKPKAEGFPLQVELFSRVPDMIKVPKGVHLIPIPVGEDLSSFSAILMDEEYYYYAVQHTILLNDLNFIDREAVVLLKAKAYINNSVRKTNGEQVRSEDISKHKNDVFRIATTFTDSDTYEISETLKTDLRLFLEMVGKDGIGSAGLCKDLGLRNEITIEVFTERIKKTFGL